MSLDQPFRNIGVFRSLAAYALASVLLACIPAKSSSAVKGASMSCMDAPAASGDCDLTVPSDPDSGEAANLGGDNQATTTDPGKKVTITAPGFSQDITVHDLGSGHVGQAYTYIDPQTNVKKVLKIPVNEDTKYWQSEVRTFTNIRKTMDENQIDFAQYIVPTTKVQATIDGRTVTGLVKDYVSGQDFWHADILDPEVKAAIDQFYVDYKASYEAGFQIFDLKADNVIWDDSHKRIRIIDALENTGNIISGKRTYAFRYFAIQGKDWLESQLNRDQGLDEVKLGTPPRIIDVDQTSTDAAANSNSDSPDAKPVSDDTSGNHSTGGNATSDDSHGR